MSQSVTQDTSQYIDNKSFDPDFQISAELPVESDGTNLRKKQTNLVAKKITDTGDGNVYVAIAPIGTDQATAGWQVKKINTSGNDTVITWADGNANFDNVATDLTTITYS